MKFRTGLALLLVSIASMFCFSCASIINSSPIILTEFLKGAVEGMTYTSTVQLSDKWGIEPYNVTITGLPEGFYFTYEDNLIVIRGEVLTGMSAKSPYKVRVLVEGQLKRWDSRNYTLFILDRANGPRLDLSVDPTTVETENSVLFTAENVFPSTLAGAQVSRVFIDLTPLKGPSNVEMFDDGTHGDAVAGDGIYSVSYLLPRNIPTYTYDISGYVQDNYNIIGDDDTQLSVIGGPKIGNLIIANWIEQYDSNHSFSVNGGTSPYLWSITTEKPAWLSIGSGNGIVSGTPPIGSAGDYVFTVRVTDENGLWDDETVLLTVIEAPSAMLCVCPPEAYFGSVEFGIDYVSFDMRIFNCIGLDIFYITNLVITGTHALDFILGGGWSSSSQGIILPFQLNPNCFFDIWLYFVPQATTPANREAQLEIHYEDSNGRAYQQSVNLYGNVLNNVTSIWSEDFEGGDGGFSGTYDWEWGEPNFVDGPSRASTGNNVWGTNLTGNNDSAAHSFGSGGSSGDYYLRSPNVPVSGASNVIVSYRQWYRFNGTAENEWTNTQGVWAEGGNIATSMTSGLDWNNVGTYDILPWYNLTTNFSTNSPPPESCWTNNGGFWRQHQFYVSTSAASHLQFQFAIGNDGVSGGTRAGWYIDDVSVYDYDQQRLRQPYLYTPEYCEIIDSDTQTVDVEFVFWPQFSGYTYELVIGQESDLSDGQVYASQATTGMSVFETVNLPNDGTYFWQVNIINASATAYGRISSFTLTSAPGAFYGEIYPPNQTHFYTQSSAMDVPIGWDEVSGADYYNVYISSSLPIPNSPANSSPITGSIFIQTLATFDLTVSMTWFVQIEAVNSEGARKYCVITYYFGDSPTDVVINEVITDDMRNLIEIANFNDFPVYVGGWELEVFEGAPGVSQGVFTFPTNDPRAFLTPWATSGFSYLESGILTVNSSTSVFPNADYTATFDFGWLNDNLTEIEVILRYDSTNNVDYMGLNQAGNYANDPFSTWIGDIPVNPSDISVYRQTTNDTDNAVDWASGSSGSIGEHNPGQ